LNADGELVQDMDTIKLIAPEYYRKLLNQDDYIVSFPDLVVKKILTDEAKD